MNEQEHIHKKLDTKITVLLGLLVLLAVALVAGLLLVNRTQDIREQASGPSCPVNGATCDWDAVPGASDYTVQVERMYGDGWLPVAFTETGATSIQFTPEADQTYRCLVTAVMDDPTCEPSGGAQITCTSTDTPVSLPVTTATTTPLTTTPTISVQVSTTTTPTGSPTSIPTGSQTGTPASSPTGSGTATPSTSTTSSPTQSSSQSTGATATPTTYFVGGGSGSSPTSNPTSSSNGVTTSPTSKSSSPTISTSSTGTTTPTTTTSVTSAQATDTSHTPTLPTTGIPHASILLLLFGVLIISFGLLL